MFVLFILSYFVVGRDLSRKMRRNKLDAEARKQRTAPEKLKLMSKQQKHRVIIVFLEHLLRRLR